MAGHRDGAPRRDVWAWASPTSLERFRREGTATAVARKLGFDCQIAALDAFDQVADDPLIHLEMDLAPGDIQFIHNHQMLHDRRPSTKHCVKLGQHAHRHVSRLCGLRRNR